MENGIIELGFVRVFIYLLSLVLEVIFYFLIVVFGIDDDFVIVSKFSIDFNEGIG